MYVLPFITLSPYTYKVLTVGGTHLWEEDDSLRVEDDVLTPNGLYLSSAPRPMHHEGEIVYLCEIDQERTSVDDFYEWSDITLEDRDTFAWRLIHHLPSVPPPQDAILDPVPLSCILASLRST